MNFPKVGDPLPNGYSVLANYRNKIIMAQSPCRDTPQPYVVWHLSSTGDTWGGHYSTDLKTAEKWFAALCFDWLYDAINEKTAPEAEIQERQQMGKVNQERKIKQHQFVLDKYPHPTYNQRNHD